MWVVASDAIIQTSQNIAFPPFFFFFPTVTLQLAQKGQKPVTTKEGQAVADNIKAFAFLECSAKEKQGVHEIFHTATAAKLKAHGRKTRKRSSFIKGITSKFGGAADDPGKAKAKKEAHAAMQAKAPKETVDRKLVVVGDCVGKTGLLKVKAQGTFPKEYVPTVYENYVTWVELPEAKVELALWDTAGQEDYAHIRPHSYDAAHVFLICCSVDNKDSFDNITEKWVPEIMETNPKCPFLIIGCKGDTRANGAAGYSIEDGRALAASVGAAAYLECSAISNTGVDEVFLQATKVAYYGKTKFQKEEAKKLKRANAAREKYGRADRYGNLNLELLKKPAAVLEALEKSPDAVKAKVIFTKGIDISGIRAEIASMSNLTPSAKRALTLGNTISFDAYSNTAVSHRVLATVLRDCLLLAIGKQDAHHFDSVAWLWDTRFSRDEALQKIAKEVILRPAPAGHSTLWHEIVKLDLAAGVVDQWIRQFPGLAKEKDADRRKAYDVASQAMKKHMDEILQFCGRFEVNSTRREHESATCIVIRAMHVGGWLSKHTLTLGLAQMDTRFPLSQFGALFEPTDKQLFDQMSGTNGGGDGENSDSDDYNLTADVQTNTPTTTTAFMPSNAPTTTAVLGDNSLVIQHIEPGGLADRAGWKVGFEVTALSGSNVESREHLLILINDQIKAGAATCRISVDSRPDEPEPVVLKLMKNKEQYDREIKQREQLDPGKCAPVIFHSADAPALWEAGVKQRGYPEYKYGIVMPAAERNLLVVLVQERVTFTGIRTMLRSVAECLQHMHKAGKVHGDLKPLNVVRTYQDEFQLIDFDATVEIGQPIGAKTSTAYVPPELIAEGSTPGHPVVKSHNNLRARAAVEKWMVKALPQRESSLPLPDHPDAGCDDDSNASNNSNALVAHPTFDIWSFAIVAYRALARELLFKSDDSDNAPIAELDRLFKWDHSALDQSMRKLQNVLVSGGLLMGGKTSRSSSTPATSDVFVAVELLTWLLQPNPSNRPQSFDAVLDHPFFDPDGSNRLSAIASADHDTSSDYDSDKSPEYHLASSTNYMRGFTSVGDATTVQGDGNPSYVFASAMPLGSGTWLDENWRMSATHVGAALGTLTLLGSNSLHTNTPEPLMHRTPLHLAVSGGHVDVVEILLDPTMEMDPDLKNRTGRTALHGLLVALEESTTTPTSNQVQIAQLLFGACNLELVDSDGRSAMKLGSSSRWKVVRDVFSRRVIMQIEHCEHFNPVDFMAVWAGSDDALRTELENQLWATIRTVTTRPITTKKKAFLKEAIFPLMVWEEEKMFAELKRVAAEQETLIVAETHRVRDSMFPFKGLSRGCASGNKLRTLKSFTEKVQQTFPIDAMASLGYEFKSVTQRDMLEEAVIVPLLHLRSEQAVGHFAKEMRRVLPNAEVKGVGADDVDPPRMLHISSGKKRSGRSRSRRAAAAATARWCDVHGMPPRDTDTERAAAAIVEIAPVKGEPRMKFKVLEYRDEMRNPADGAVAEATLVEGADGTRRWRPEALEQLGDCLRCTVECTTGDVVWAAYEAIRDGFDLKPGNGRLKNNMDPELNNMDSADPKPPDILINVVLGTNDEIIYPMVAEIQVHLAAINLLKHENHILYKVRRAENASELRQSTISASAEPATPAAVATPVQTALFKAGQPAAVATGLSPLGDPLAPCYTSSMADALAAEVVQLKEQMQRMAKVHALQQREAETHAAQLQLEVQGMEELLLEQAEEPNVLQNGNSTSA